MSISNRVFTVAGVVALLAALPSTADGNGILGTAPAWRSNLAHVTRGLAVADLDLDGDLDMICANRDGPNTVYLNMGGRLATEPFWSSPASQATMAVAAGDINGDGYPDLIFGNYGEQNELYLNRHGTFPETPDWQSTSTNKTTCVALGDLDGDLDLDLLCGNEGQANTLYLNRLGGTLLDSSPAWRSSETRSTFSLAVGDLDGDGDLDVVSGNDGEKNAVYVFNDTLELSPWVPDARYRTLDVALADIDGDGRLDLVCANANGPNLLYTNTGATDFFRPDAMATTPASWAAASLVTVAVDLGDLNGDGRIDVVFGNHDQPEQLYITSESGVPGTLAWESVPLHSATLDIALADVDGDGDLELACANGGQDGENNTLYVNEDPVLYSTPAWRSGATSSSFTVAAEDVDRDGLPELAFGNGRFFDQKNALYMNRGGTLDSIPVWVSPAPNEKTIGVALADISGDDLPDIVWGNANQANSCYLNRWDEGVTTVFPTGGLPDWSSDQSPIGINVTAVVTLGDVDMDGDLDLVCANGGTINQRSTLYLNTGVGTIFSAAPAWLSQPQASIGAALGDMNGDGLLDLVLGNNNGQANVLYLNIGGDSTFTRTPVWQSGRQKDTFGVALGDVDGDDDLDLVCATGGTGDQRNTLYLNDGGPSVLARLPAWEAGLDRSTTFDVKLGDVDADGDLDLFCGNGGTDREPNTLYLNVGDEAVFSHLPAWTSAESNHSFGVAVADMDNDGDLDAVFANDGEGNTVYLGKRNPVFKMDPLRPTNHRPNNGPIIRGVSTNLVDAVTYRIAFELIDVESDPVWIVPEYKFTGSANWHPVTVSGALPERPWNTSPRGEPHSFDWKVSSVPRDARSIQLRLRAVEIPRRAGRVQHVVTHLLEVDPIQTITSAAEPPFEEGNDISVVVTLPPGVTPSQGTLFYRRGGDDRYEQTGLEPEGTQVTRAVGRIPGSIVGPRGVEYFVRVETHGMVLTDPRSEPDQSPRGIRTAIANLEEPLAHAEAQYRMLSIPMEVTGTARDVLRDDVPGEIPDTTAWRLYAYDPGKADYDELTFEWVLASMPSGCAYWFITSTRHRVDTAPAAGRSTPTDRDFVVILERGWNMVGNPFSFAVEWSELYCGDVPCPEAVDSMWIEGPLRYEPQAMIQYAPVQRLEPFEGYWIGNFSDTDSLRLRIPPRAAAPRVDARVQPVPSAANDGGTWRIQIIAATASAVDGSNFIGVDPAALDGRDPLDRREPPAPPGGSIALYFPHRSWGKSGGYFTTDLRPASGRLEPNSYGIDGPDSLRGNVWQFDIAKTAINALPADRVDLTFVGTADLPDHVQAFMVDRELGRWIDIKQENGYTFYLGKKGFVAEDIESRFLVLGGTRSFVESKRPLMPTAPKQALLLQNFPNPFNPTTLIRYDVAERGETRLVVYDVTGARVRGLVSRVDEPGRYEVVWQGRDDRGRQVASGIYFYRLDTERFSATKKMTLLK